jgi:hypothetical protein
VIYPGSNNATKLFPGMESHHLSRALHGLASRRLDRLDSPGLLLTENVRVRSIIGRFLEHSRIFYFANGSEDRLAGDYFFGSADWMFRNLSRRVEAVTPVLDRNHRERLWEILNVCLRDDPVMGPSE